MLLTETEAKQKWCPFVRTGIEGRSSVAVNRTMESSEHSTGGPYDIYDMTRCIASACMAWCWSGEYQTGNDEEGKTTEERRGWCGAAAKGEP